MIFSAIEARDSCRASLFMQEEMKMEKKKATQKLNKVGGLTQLTEIVFFRFIITKRLFPRRIRMAKVSIPEKRI